jgi:translation initiation factor IF-2
MAEFTEVKTKKTAKKASSWAMEDSSEDEAEPEPVPTPVEEEVEVSSSSESEDEAPLQAIPSAVTEESSTKPKPVARKKLTKKEVQLLKQQELEDLDAVLSEFKADLGESEASAVDSAPVEVPATAAEDSSSKKKKPKKKKAPSAATAAAPAAEAAAPVVVDVAAMLKAKQAGKSTGKKSSLTDSQRIAAAELKAQNDSKKKKVDKSKFCEMPDFN